MQCFQFKGGVRVDATPDVSLARRFGAVEVPARRARCAHGMAAAGALDACRREGTDMKE